MSRILMLLISSTIALSVYAGDPTYKDFIEYKNTTWKKYTEDRKTFLSCMSPKDTSQFLLKSVNLDGNAELDQAYNGAIGEGIITNPSCVLNALLLLPTETQNKIINHHIVRPLLKDINEIEKSLMKVWQKKKYSNVKTEFLRLKKEIYVW